MRAVLWISVLGMAAFFLSTPLADPDLWWHITVGRWILANQIVPANDYWNMFYAGEPWVAYSWLIEIIFALFESWGGLYGLLILKFATSLLLTFSLGYCFARISRDWFVGLLFALLTLAASSTHFSLRPQAFVWVYFIWLIFVADALAEKSRANLLRPRDEFKFYFFFALLMAFWANSHLTAILGLFTLACWLWKETSQRVLLISLLAATAGTFFTPYLGYEWIIFLQKASHPFDHSIIAEFQAATILQYRTAFLLLAIFFLLYLLYLAPRAVKFPRLALVIVFVIASLAIGKFLPMGVIVSFAVVASIWARESERISQVHGPGQALMLLKKQLLRVPKEGLSFVFIVLAILAGVHTWRAVINERMVPVSALDFIKEQDLQLPLLHGFTEGGYVMFRYANQAGEPGYLVPIDGRTNVIPADVWRKYSKAAFGQRGWQEYLELVKPETILWRSDRALVSILLATGQWCDVYDRYGYTILIKRDEFYRRADLSSPTCSQ